MKNKRRPNTRGVLIERVKVSASFPLDTITQPSVSLNIDFNLPAAAIASPIVKHELNMIFDMP